MKKYDMICVGGGIMSTTLALLIKSIDPSISVAIFERLDDVALESSAAWNNAGTGHSALCELNYTPMNEEGEVDISKAIKIFKQFELSKQFWVYLKQNQLIENPSEFINAVPHHSWVTGEDNVSFLKARFERITQHPFFAEMEYTEALSTMQKWFPLIMHGRTDDEIQAATRMESGTELNYGALTKRYQTILKEEYGVEFFTKHEVKDIDPTEGVEWLVEVKDKTTSKTHYFDAEHVFIGAGGWALPLLQKVEIEEKDGYGGFPVSGQWLACKNEEIIEKHFAKVYSKAGPDAPPMSTPHLDTRIINGKRELLFGPFAGFSTKFLKEGSYLDLPKSINMENLSPMFGAFWKNLELTRYLIDQVRMGHEDRMNELRKFDQDAKSDDWELKVAGQRVQIIKKDEEQGGILQFGTEVVHSVDGNITALLGASPGASVAVDVMMDVIEFAFPENMSKWKAKINEILPFYHKDAEENIDEFMTLREKNTEVLGLVQ